jgi:hypothetical protein
MCYCHRNTSGKGDAMKRTLGIAVAVAGLGLAAASASLFELRAPAHRTSAAGVAIAPVFSEENWPFLIDQWGVGKAFVCAAADCGSKVEVFIRPKIGFCNCSTGVDSDQELERVSDTDLVSPQTRPLAAGEPVKIGWMNGLARRYRAADGKIAGGLVSVAFNDECDVVVAVARTDAGDPTAIAPAVIAFLQSTPMVMWAKKELGLEFVKRVW